MPGEDLALGADFPAATAGQWRELALAALRKSGAATGDTGLEQVDELLATTTYDGLTLAALHTADGDAPPPAGLPGQWPFVRGARASGGLAGGWDVRQRHTGTDPKEVREAVLADLENGATSIWLAVGGDALPIDALPEALDGVHPELAGIVLDPRPHAEEAAEAWFALLRAREIDLGRVTGGLGSGSAALARRCVAEAPGLRAITVDATVQHEAGGSDAQELGCAAAAGVAHLRALTDAGLPVEAALSQLEFRYAATADQFATIAKLRAARRIWARVAELCGAPAAGGQRQHAVTSAAMMTARDPWVNLLRTTIAAFAAGVGGAEAVTVLPFDSALGRPDAFARRLARNTQVLLVEEAHVARVLDPAGGSFYVERYTDELAHAGWRWFTEIERAGGFAAAGDLIAGRLAETRQRRESDVAHRRAPITGVSEFPDLTEQVPQRRPGTGGRTHRYAEAYERLRDRSDAHLAATGSRPSVRLVTLGRPPGARLAFATNLFAAGGIELRDDAPATVVCLCGSDSAYAEQAAATAAALRSSGTQRVLLAGQGDFPGIDRHVHTGSDAVEALTATLADLEVPL